ncbi:MAG TPA: hypothetical protein VGE04_13545 [Chloroflexia bacterium]
MLKLLSLGFLGSLLVLGLSACGTSGPAANSTPTSVQPTQQPTGTTQANPDAWPPKLADATTILIQDDWSGLSPVAPLQALYSLERGADGFSGRADFSAGGYRADPITATETIAIPADVAQKFLEMLADPALPMKEGTYEPRIDHTDDYPSLGILVELPGGEQVAFGSGSQGEGHVPWGLTYKGKTYIVDSALPSEALDTLRPYLKEEVLERLQQMVMGTWETPGP